MITMIVAAGGRGIRSGVAGGKQLAEINGRPMLSYCLELFENSPLVAEVVVAADERILESVKKLASSFSKVASVVAGDEARSGSVRKALEEISEDAGLAGVHDGARPLVSLEVIERLYEKMTGGHRDGVVPALPLKETVKIVRDGDVVETYPRERLMAVQTPQLFDAGRLKAAYGRLSAADAASFTDDASIVEHDGGRIAVVEGDESNIKVTTPNDFLIAGLLLKEREICA